MIPGASVDGGNTGNNPDCVVRCNADENGMDGQSGESGSEEKWRRTSTSSVDIVLSCVVCFVERPMDA